MQVAMPNLTFIWDFRVVKERVGASGCVGTRWFECATRMSIADVVDVALCSYVGGSECCGVALCIEGGKGLSFFGCLPFELCHPAMLGELSAYSRGALLLERGCVSLVDRVSSAVGVHRVGLEDGVFN